MLPRRVRFRWAALSGMGYCPICVKRIEQIKLFVQSGRVKELSVGNGEGSGNAARRGAGGAGGRGWWGSSERIMPKRRIRDLPFTFKPSKEVGRKVATLSAVGVCALSVLGFSLVNPARQAQKYPVGTLNPPSLTELTAGCAGVVDVNDPPEGTNGWIEQQTAPTWATFPPVSGNYYQTPFLNLDKPVPFDPEKGEYPKFGEAVNLLYHGWIVIWYRNNVVNQEDVDAFTAQIQSIPSLEGRVLVSPWPYGANPAWSGEKPWVFTAWGSWEKCQYANVKVAQQFGAAHPKEAAPGGSLPLLEPGPHAMRFNIPEDEFKGQQPGDE